MKRFIFAWAAISALWVSKVSAAEKAGVLIGRYDCVNEKPKGVNLGEVKIFQTEDYYEIVYGMWDHRVSLGQLKFGLFDGKWHYTGYAHDGWNEYLMISQKAGGAIMVEIYDEMMPTKVDRWNCGPL